MSRNIVTRDSTGESFAGLLEYLTQHAMPETERTESGVYFESRADIVSSAVSGSVADLTVGSPVRAQTHALLPVTEVKAGRSSTPDGMQLSYEQALRAHRRHGLPSDSDLDLPSVDAPRANPVLDRPQEQAEKRSQPQKRTEASARAQTELDSASQSRQSPKLPDQIRVGIPVRVSNPASSQASARRRDKAKAQKTSAPPKQSEVTALQSGAQLHRPLKMRRLDLQLDQLNQLDQRRSAVSVRLTDGELARLRNRAEESGISVSAYVRSCVLDAENLRAQVKQALAEMRAIHEKPEPVRPPLLAASVNTVPANRGAWRRQLLKSAALLLSPLFPVRRSA